MKRKSVSFHTTPNGLRIVHLSVPGASVGYFGVAVRVGSRDDGEGHHGLAHFVEHTIFKGTAKRRSWHIINRMESVGGELNAFTTKEETVVYSAFPKGNLNRAAELISDLITSSQFPEHELEKEREVVADEIESYLDTPSEAVFDDFEEAMFAGSSLAHNILGTRHALEGFSSELCQSYLKKWYTASNMVAFYAGCQGPERVMKTIERYFGALPSSKAVTHRATPGAIAPFHIYKKIESHQCHTIVGARVGSISSPERYSTALLTNILGGPGMNSLLNVALRERRGLVYSVDASTGLFSDSGSLAIYYGCDPKDNEKCLSLVQETVKSVADGYITSKRLEAAKKQYLGQLEIASENVENRILAIARQALFLGYVQTGEELTDSIRSISAEHLAAAANLELSSITLGS